MKITKRQLRRIIKEELSRVLTEGAAKPDDIKIYLKDHGLEAGIDYDFGGDGEYEGYYIIPLRNNADDLVSMLDDELYSASPIRGKYLKIRDGKIHWT